MRDYFLIAVTFMFVGLAQAQQATRRSTNSTDFLQQFSQIPQQDDTIATYDPFNFKSHKYNGHIQGIQLYNESGTDYLYMTRSAPFASFIIRAKWEGKKTTAMSMDTLLLAPYGHPGGFQIFKNYLAVGIEDENARTTSRVMVYDLKKQGNRWSAPLHAIKRDGKYERVTAGCVGLTKVGKNILIAVGNWHSRDIDFYICPEKKFKKGKDGFQLIQSIEIAQVSKKEWSDSIWQSYQNINLFSDGSEDRLYLVGFAGRGADVFELTITNGGLKTSKGANQNTIQIKKIQSQNFTVTGDASFGAGAGISFPSNGKMILFAAPGDIGGGSTISVYNREN